MFLDSTVHNAPLISQCFTCHRQIIYYRIIIVAAAIQSNPRQQDHPLHLAYCLPWLHSHGHCCTVPYINDHLRPYHRVLPSQFFFYQPLFSSPYSLGFPSPFKQEKKPPFEPTFQQLSLCLSTTQTTKWTKLQLLANSLSLSPCIPSLPPMFTRFP